MKSVACTTLLALAVYTTVASALIALAVALSIIAVAVWWQNRDNLRALDDMLREKAAQGKAVLERVDGA